MVDNEQIKDLKEEKIDASVLAKELVEKAKVQYAWYVNMYPVHMRDSVAKNLLQLEMNNVVCCNECGIPSGMTGITMRTLKINENGKKKKISLCPRCMADKIKSINTELNSLNQ